MIQSAAEILNEYGPFPGIERVNGVSYDGRQVWLATGDKLEALDPESGKIVRSIHVGARAGTAFDGRYLYQISEDRIQKIEPESGQVLGTIPTPGEGCSGMAWGEGSLWVAVYEQKKIYQIEPDTGTVIRAIASNRHVTGVTWVDGELWHGTWEDNDDSDVRRIDPQTGEALESLALPAGVGVSGLESDGGERFFCGGGRTGKLRVIRRPRRNAAPAR